MSFLDFVSSCVDGLKRVPCNTWIDGDPSKPGCIACEPDNLGDTFAFGQRPCVIEFVLSTRRQKQLCNTFGIGGSLGAMFNPRGYNVSYQTGHHDIEGNALPFFAGPGGDPNGTYFAVRYYLTPDVSLLVDPCHPGFCPFGFNPAPHLCRAVLCHLSGVAWKLWCNPLISGDQGAGTPSDAVLTAPRAIRFSLDVHGQIGLVHFLTDGRGHCFPFEEQFCLTEACGPTVEFETVWECLGTEAGGAGFDQLTELDRLFIQLDIKMAADQTTYPMFNSADVTLKNQALSTLSSYLDQLDRNGHSRTRRYDSPAINLWSHSESFSAPPPPGDPRQISPPVTVDGSRGGTPIDIQCQINGTNIYLPAQLTLDEVNVRLNMSVQAQPGVNQSNGSALPRRALGNVDIDLSCRVKLLPAAYDMAAPFTFLTPSDPFDLRLEDGAHPGTLHPTAFIIPRGHDASRVPLHLHWRGVRGHHPYAKEPAFQNTIFNNSKSVVCRGGIQAMHGATFFGEIDHHYDPDGPQRHEGSVTVLMESLI